MSPPGEKLNELEKTLPADRKAPDGVQADARRPAPRRARRLRTRLIVFLATTLCLWLWVLHRRQLDVVPTRLPQEDSYISWPLAIADAEADEPEAEKPHPPPHHKLPKFLNGKIAEHIFL